MHVLLPPSETKSAGGRGRPLRGRLGDGPLGAARAAAVDALAALVAGDPRAAAEALLLPAGAVSESLAADAAVLDSPTMPALRRYAGVVYGGLAFAAMSAPEQRLALRSVHVFSGLFGVVRADEAVPAYRVPGKAVLPGLGVMSTYWRPVLSDVLPGMLRHGIVVDLRSGDYAAMWRPTPAVAERVVTVRVLSPVPRGGHAVVSYNSKFAKGRLAAALITRIVAGRPVEHADDVASAWASCDGLDCVARGPGALDLYTA